MVRLVVDSREKAKNTVVEYFRLKGFDVSVERLDAGDYLVTGSENYIVERKSLPDFAKSIVDLRLWEDLKGLKRVENARPLLIVEFGRLYGGFELSSVYGALASVVFDFGVPAIPTMNLGQTIMVLERLCVRALGKPSKTPVFKRKAETLEELQMRILCSLPGVSTARAKRLLRRFGSVRAVFNATAEELKTVELIGPRTAERIYEVVNAKYGS